MLEYSLSVKLLTEHHLEFLSLNGGWTGSYESTLVKMPHCWKSHVCHGSYAVSTEISYDDPYLFYLNYKSFMHISILNVWECMNVLVIFVLNSLTTR